MSAEFPLRPGGAASIGGALRGEWSDQAVAVSGDWRYTYARTVPKQKQTKLTTSELATLEASGRRFATTVIGRCGRGGTLLLRGQALMQTPPGALGWFSGLPALGARGLCALIILALSIHPFFELLLGDPDWRIVIDSAWIVALISGLYLAFHSAGIEWIAWSLPKLPMLWLVLLIAIASSLWSPDPLLTLKSASWMIGTSIVGVALGYLVSPKILVRVLFWLFSGILVASLAAEMLSFEAADRWQGATSNPNLLGAISAYAGVFFLIALLFHRLYWQAALSMCVLATLLLLMTRSATSVVMLVTGVAAVVCFRLGKRLHLGGDVALLLVVVGLVGCAAIGLVHWEGTTSLLGKDVTATTRTWMWEDAIAAIEYRPLSGHGYGVVWGLGDHSFFPELKTTLTVHQAHNGYLQVAAQLGLPSLAMAVALVVHTLIRGIAGYIRWGSTFALFSAIYVTIFAVSNMTEARLFEPDQFDWLLFVTLATALARAGSGPAGGCQVAASSRRNFDAWESKR